MILETERLILRPWNEDDAEELYKYACDPDVGPHAAWPVHTSVENSREIIKNVLAAEGTFAVVLKETGLPIGSVGVMREAHVTMGENEVELGYWLGKPYWGRGLIPEAAKECIRYSFDDLGCERVWCCCDEDNMNSRRVQEKCGFQYRYTEENKYFPLIDVYRTERVSVIERKDWKK